MTRRFPRRTLAAALLLALAPPAVAGNDDGVLIGPEAALSGGAVTAVVSDGSALYYNPAGLARAPTDTVDVSASVFMLRYVEVDRLVYAPGGEADTGEVLDILSVPSALSYARPLGDGLYAGYGLFVTASDDTHIRSHITLEEGLQSGRWLVNVSTSEQLYRGGGGLAWALGDVRVGLSLFGLYNSISGREHFSGSTTGPDGTVAFIEQTDTFSVTNLGLELRAGLTWDPSPSWRVGLSVSSPSVSFFRDLSIDGAISGATRGGEPTFVPLVFDESEWGLEVFAPARVRLGVAYGDGGSWISLDLDVQHALENETLNVKRDAVFNGRIGGIVALDESISVGGGFFSDLSADPEAHAFGETKTDFVGLALGVEISNRHLLARSEPADSLVFRTDIGLRYAYGFGRMAALEVDLLRDLDATDIVQTPRRDVSVHELALHVGSAFYF